jgi:Mg-chelatase subunit ChlD
MSYVSESLAQGERVIVQAKTHWIVFFAPFLTFLIGVFLFNATSIPLIIAAFVLAWSIAKWLTTELALTNMKVIAKWGVFSSSSIQQFLSKVDGIQVNQSILGRLLDYGSISVLGTGLNVTPIKTIADPLAFRRAFEDAIRGLNTQPAAGFSATSPTHSAPLATLATANAQSAQPKAPSANIAQTENYSEGVSNEHLYSAEISRERPTCIMFIIDQSGSMGDPLPTGRSKASFIADALNRTLVSLVTNCTKADGIRSYFDIAVIGYGGNEYRPGLAGTMAQVGFFPVSTIGENPLRIEQRVRSEDDGAGGIVERNIKFPVWFDAKHDGGTPMKSALSAAYKLVAEWCADHHHSYPPTVIHLTDGESTDGDPEEVAKAIKTIGTSDGACMLFNIHVASGSQQSLAFPTNVSQSDQNAQRLFRMSSQLPRSVANRAKEKGYLVDLGARGYVYNADPKDIVNFLDIGTRLPLAADR